MISNDLVAMVDLRHLSVAQLVGTLPAKREVHGLILSDLTHLFRPVSLLRVAWALNILKTEYRQRERVTKLHDLVG
jgi:hypothetical protein